MDNQPTLATLDSERPSVRDVWEVARLPGLFALVTAAVTWLIWYYTNAPCTPELANRIGCNLAAIASYINVDIFGRMLTYSAITAAAGGVWNYDMFTKMRATIAAERRRADEAVQQLAEYRQQVEEERRQAEETRRQERQQAEEERRQAEEERRQERQQVEEERRQEHQQAEEARRQEHEAFMTMLAEERRRSDEERQQMHQAFMASLTEITAQMAHLIQQRNGNNGDERNGS